MVKNGKVPLVNSVDGIKPNPLDAREDRGEMYADGCLLLGPRTESGECVYGDPEGDVSVVLFGDSHSMMYMPTLDAIGEEAGCATGTRAAFHFITHRPHGDVHFALHFGL